MPVMGTRYSSTAFSNVADLRLDISSTAGVLGISQEIIFDALLEESPNWLGKV